MSSVLSVLLPVLLAVLMVAGLVVALPGPVSAAKPHPWRDAQVLDPVPTSPARPHPGPRDVAASLAAGAAPVPAPVWPVAGEAVADFTGVLAAARETGRMAPVTAQASVRPGGLPVRVSHPAPIRSEQPAGQVPAKVRVRSLDRATVAGVVGAGLGVRLSRADGGTGPAALTVGLGYAGVVGGFGGDWGGRLRAVVVPECGLSTPAAPGCRPVPVASRNDPGADLVTTSVSVPATASGVVVMLVAGDSSTQGDYTATSLRPSASWSAGGSTGDFAWVYPLRLPPSLGGPAPVVSVSYSSQSVDGLTSASNTQPSWLGDGFSYDPGFIERRYRACADDGHPGTGDQCWGSDNAVLSMPGRGGELIADDTDADLFHPKRDDGTLVRRLRDTGLGNGDNDGEYWKVTTTDGTQYFFGRNRISGWVSGRAETNSVSYAPVFGDDAGEPCHVSTFANAWCLQAYRWHLDYVVDPHGNTTSYWYTRQMNNYARTATASAVSSYVRAETLARVDYGTDNRSGTDTTFTGTAPARVVFTTVDRCAQASGCEIHDAAHWPDVPWDRECTSSSTCSGRYAPTFWSTKRLSSVTTQVATGPGVWKDVDAWTMAVSWPVAGDGSQAKLMWLSSITQTGRNGSAPDLTLPAVTFAPTGTTMLNRVNFLDGNGHLQRYRLATIWNETGGAMGISYSPADCVAGSKMPANPESNTYRCFPVYWTPPGGSQILDYFHKYVVTGVGLSDQAGGNEPGGTAYAYPTDGGFWHYDTSELTPPGKKTWGVWRGYEQVTQTVGDVKPGAAQLQTVATYFRGRHGDHLPSGTRTQTYTVNGTVYNDEDWLAGMPRERVVLDGPGGAVVTRTLTEPWWSGPTATRTLNGVTTAAYATNTLRTTVKTTLDGGRLDRVVAVTNSFTDGADGTPRGRVLTVDDEGDTATSADDVCTRYSYARNDAAHLHSLVARVETTGLRCAQTPTVAAQVLSVTRSFYDHGTVFPTTPSKGEVTRTQELSVWDAAPANQVYVDTSETSYDDYGRVEQSRDALGRLTTTGYFPAGGAPVTSSTVTNPKGWHTTTLLEPAWGAATRITDPNGRVTDLGYDALGRLTAVWLPGWSKAAHPSLPSKGFAYTVRNSGGPAAVATSTLNTGGTAMWTSYELFDGFLRPRQTQTLPPTGTGRVIADTYHDSRGLITKTNAPYYTTGAPGTTLMLVSDLAVPAQNRVSFDGAGRNTGTQLLSYAVERWHTSTAHGGDRVDLTPPSGGTATSTLTDARGRTSALRQYHDPTPTPHTPGSYDTTSYTHDHAGRLTNLVDPAGITWSWGHDQRGRQTSVADPDNGITTSSYDDAGRLVSSTDARGVTLSYVYDELDRMTELWHGPVGSGTKRAEWAYDSILLGQPTSSTRYDNGHAYLSAVTGYDAGYRPTGTSVTIPAIETGLAGVYSFATTYTANGSVSTRTVPAAAGLPAETLTTTYYPNGAPRKLTGTNQYVTQTTYLQTGPVSSMTHDTVTAYRSFDYDPATLRLSHLNVQAASSPDILAETDYGYDDAGNITKISDRLAQYGSGYGPDDTQCFDYDHLRRLTQAWTPASNNCATAPTVAGLGGAAPYWLSWTADAAGNRTSQTSHTAGGDQTITYTHPLPTQPRPHTLLSTTGAQVGSYSYDTTGNTTSRPGPTAQQTLTWDPEGHLASVNEGANTSSYLYDTAGARLLTRDPTGTTLHLPMGVELHANPGGGGLTCTRGYSHAGQVIATRTTSAGLSWLFQDHHGTAAIAIGHTTMSISRRHQTPYGTPRGTIPSWPNQHGYVDGFNDTTGLTHLGAREYDAAAGRFISDDPVTDVANPQQINGYNYANNSPVTLSDPDGLDPGGGQACDAGLCRPGAKPPAPAPPPTHPYGGTPGKKDPSEVAKPKVLSASAAAGTDRLCAYPASTAEHCQGLVQHELFNSLTGEFLTKLIRYAQLAGVDPRLLLATLIRESGDCHCGPKGDWRWWDVSKGMSNMKGSAFDEAKAASGGAITFEWGDVTGAPDKAALAGAFYLKVKMDALPEGFNNYYSKEEMARIGYRFDGSYYQKAYTGGHALTGDAADELVNFHLAWEVADFLTCHAGIYSC